MKNAPIRQGTGGLSWQEARSRLEKHGYNELKADRSRGVIKIVIGTVKEPMIMLLICIGVLYSFIGATEDVYSLLFFLGLIVCISVYQENKTEKTLHALKKLSSPRAMVFRDGRQIRIPGREVVPCWL